jgi:hypothetical protein
MKLYWAPEMIDALRALRRRNVPIYRCAERVGVGYASAVYKCRELGIADRRNRGRTRGEAIQPTEQNVMTTTLRTGALLAVLACAACATPAPIARGPGPFDAAGFAPHVGEPAPDPCPTVTACLAQYQAASRDVYLMQAELAARQEQRRADTTALAILSALQPAPVPPPPPAYTCLALGAGLTSCSPNL